MPDLTEIARNLDRFLRHLHRKMPARAEAEGVALMSSPASLALLALADRGPGAGPMPMSMQELARHLARDKSQITRLVRELEARGLVARVPHPDDARVTLLSLTDDGADRFLINDGNGYLITRVVTRL